MRFVDDLVVSFMTACIRFAMAVGTGWVYLQVAAFILVFGLAGAGLVVGLVSAALHWV